jgi:hypothetical protein
LPAKLDQGKFSDDPTRRSEPGQHPTIYLRALTELFSGCQCFLQARCHFQRGGQMEISFYEESGGLLRRNGVLMSEDLSIQTKLLMRKERQQAANRSLQSLDLQRACGAPTRILNSN